MYTIRLFMYDSTGKANLITTQLLTGNYTQAGIRDFVDCMAGIHGYRQGDGCAQIVDSEGFIIDKLEFQP